MKIGIYKPFKKIYFGATSADETAAWSYEVVALVDLAEKAGHEVVMLSPCDRSEIDKSDWMDEAANNHLDRIIIVGGAFEEDKYDIKDLITKCRNLADRVDLLITDQKLIPDFDKVKDNKYDNIYSQGQWYYHGSYRINTIRSYTEELVAYYRHNVKPSPKKKDKNIEFYFGGGERGRSKSFFEYVYRPDHLLCFKSVSLGIDNRVDFEQHTHFLQSAKYTIIIADEAYNESNFLIPRQYEAWMAETVTFVEAEYDHHKFISIPRNSYLRVSSYPEMIQKIAELNQNQAKREDIIAWQTDQLTSSVISGRNIKRALDL